MNQIKHAPATLRKISNVESIRQPEEGLVSGERDDPAEEADQSPAGVFKSIESFNQDRILYSSSFFFRFGSCLVFCIDQITCDILR